MPDQSASASSAKIQIPLQTAVRDYRQLMRAQILDMIIRRAEAGAPWQNIWTGPMRVHSITVEEVQSLLELRRLACDSGPAPEAVEELEPAATSDIPPAPAISVQTGPPLTHSNEVFAPQALPASSPTFYEDISEPEAQVNPADSWRSPAEKAPEQPTQPRPKKQPSKTISNPAALRPLASRLGTTAIPAAPGSNSDTGSGEDSAGYLPSAETAALQHSQLKPRRSSSRPFAAEPPSEPASPAPAKDTTHLIPAESQVGKTAATHLPGPRSSRNLIGRSLSSGSGTRWMSLKLLSALKGQRPTGIIPPVPSSPEAEQLRTYSSSSAPMQPPPQGGKRSMFGFIKGGREIFQGEFIKRLTDAAVRDQPWQVEAQPASNRQSQELDKDQRLCPRCDHKIHQRAIFCQFCHLDFSIQPWDTLPPPGLNEDYY